MRFGRLSRLRRRLYLMIPEWIRERDFELFTALLCFLAGVGLLISGVTAGSMEEKLPDVAIIVWASVLAFSPALIIMGVWMAHRHDFPKAAFWLRSESAGLKLLAYAAYLYASIIAIVIGKESGVAVPITLIFALTCHSRSAYLTIKVEDYFILLEKMRTGEEHGLG